MPFLSTLTFIFDTTNSKLDTPKQFGYDYDNNINRATIRNNFGKNNVAPTVAGFCYSVIYFIMQVMSGLLLKVASSIELDGIVVVIGELVANLDVQSSMSAVTCYKQVIHSICTVFYYVFCLFYGFGFVNVTFSINIFAKIMQHKIHNNKQSSTNWMEQLKHFINFIFKRISSNVSVYAHDITNIFYV